MNLAIVITFDWMLFIGLTIMFNMNFYEILETYHNYLEFYNMLWLWGNCITHNMQINYLTSKCLNFIHTFRNTLNKVKEAQYLGNFLNIIG